MEQVIPGKMLAMCESGVALNPELSAKTGPKWLYNLQWWLGDLGWANKVYANDYTVTFDRLPALNPHHVPPAASLVEPVDGAPIAGANVTLRAEGVARGGEMATVEYLDLPGPWRNWFDGPTEDKLSAYKSASKTAEVSALPFAANWASPAAGFHTVIERVTDTAGAEPGNTWFTPEFDDASWKQGDAPFGTEELPIARKPNTVWTSADLWLRREFEMPAGKFTDLAFVLHHDEDTEVYINGVLASKTSGYNAAYESFDITPEAQAALKPGENVMAIHCHQTVGGQYLDVGMEGVEAKP